MLTYYYYYYLDRKKSAASIKEQTNTPIWEMWTRPHSAWQVIISCTGGVGVLPYNILKSVQVKGKTSPKSNNF